MHKRGISLESTNNFLLVVEPTEHGDERSTGEYSNLIIYARTVCVASFFHSFTTTLNIYLNPTCYMQHASLLHVFKNVRFRQPHQKRGF